MTATLFEVTAADVALTSDEWYTPRWLFKAAGITFDMDVCAPIDPAFRTCPARRYLTAVEDGLTCPWDGLVWCNPPYSAPARWVDRWAAHSTGMVLVPAANSPWRGVLMAAADALTLISVKTNGPAPMIGFGRPDGSAVSYPTALILAARGSAATDAVGRVARYEPYSGGAWFVRQP